MNLLRRYSLRKESGIADRHQYQQPHERLLGSGRGSGRPIPQNRLTYWIAGLDALIADHLVLGVVVELEIRKRRYMPQKPRQLL